MKIGTVDYSVSLTVDTVEKIRTETGVNLYDAIRADFWESIADDALVMFDVAFVMFEPQLEQAGISDDDFVELFDIETHLQLFIGELYDALVNFYRESGQRTKAMRTSLLLKEARTAETAETAENE